MDEQSNTAGDGQLIAQARNDQAAFVELYRKHYDAVFRYCVHRLFERAVAEDVTSLVFLKMVENFSRFKGNEQQFRNWLYRIATNAVNDHLRKTARRNTLLKNVHEQAAEAGSGSGDPSGRLLLLRNAVLALKPRYQAIIILRFFENVKLAEIAEVLDSSPGTIRSQLARALANLRKDLSRELAEKSEAIENGS